MCSIDENNPEIYWESKPTARKVHKCCECGSPIDPGEKYHLVKGVWEGSFSTFKTCTICNQVKNEAYANGVDCICFGELWETVGVEFEEVV